MVRVTVASQVNTSIGPADPRYGEVLELLYLEAELLDGRRFAEWLELLTEDVTYRMPLRLNYVRQTENEFSDETEILTENRASLELRVKRLGTGYAWSETPPSRTRHMVSNVRVRATDTDGELSVVSNILVYRNRGWEANADIFSGERRDVLRRMDGRWRLAARTVLLDQAVLGARDVSIFL
jgi:3-phenylpropionate/cinnamic acid dioxygenase small subunit